MTFPGKMWFIIILKATNKLHPLSNNKLHSVYRRYISGKTTRSDVRESNLPSYQPFKAEALLNKDKYVVSLRPIKSAKENCVNLCTEI